MIYIFICFFFSWQLCCASFYKLYTSLLNLTDSCTIDNILWFFFINYINFSLVWKQEFEFISKHNLHDYVFFLVEHDYVFECAY